MMAHAYALLQFDDGSTVAAPRLTGRQDALVRVHDDLRACEAELVVTRRQLKAAQSDLRTARGELAEARQRKLSPEQRAEIEASGLACKAVPGATKRYTVASHTEPGKTYTVWVDGDNWRAWGCDCQGGAHGCRHKRRARQEREREARRANRPERAAVPQLTINGSRAPQ